MQPLPASEQTGALIRHHLRKNGRSQAELAAHLGIHQQGVSNRLIGKVPFDVNELASAAEFLEIPVADLLGQPDKSQAAS